VRKIATAILLLVLAGQAFDQGFFYLGYYMNRTVYLKNCVNKMRPQMHCNGKCLLMKKIEEQEKKERQQFPEMKMAAKSEIISSKSFYPATVLLMLAETKMEYLVHTIGAPVDQSAFIFHPPSA
jgi:hypothetical protein